MADNIKEQKALAPHGKPSLQPSVDNSIFYPAFIVVLLTAALLILLPDMMSPVIKTARAFTTGVFGFASMIFAGWLAYGPYGHVKLGRADEKPEYSNLHWVAMMFTCGVGAGLIVWGFAEPIDYFINPPLGIESKSQKAVEYAHMYPLFHWGVSSWSIYAVTAMPIAYLLYVKRKDVLRVSTVCEDVLPKAGRGFMAKAIDILIIFGIIGGNATALGLGIPLVSAMLAEFLGVADSLGIKIGMLVIWAALFSFSVYRGLKRGIKILADINLVLATIAILFIFIVGPTLFILKMGVNSLGLMFNNFIHISLWTDPVAGGKFPENWTIFYWTWYIAFAAFTGLFIARISRGRTIRQMVVGVMLYGTLGTSLFLIVMGGHALHLAQGGTLPVVDIYQESAQFVLTAKILAALPAGKAVLLLFIILSTIFYATNVDSAAYILSSISSKNLRGDQEPPRTNRLLWAIVLALLTAGFVYTGDVSTIQAATIVSALPLVPIIILMCLALLKWLKADFGHIVDTKVLTLPEESSDTKID